MRRPIIVLGMHRSGTSLVAELVGRWGAFGSDDFLPADYRNPQGYWEYAPLVHFNRRLLAKVRSQSFVPPSDQDEETLGVLASTGSWRNEGLQLIAAMETSTASAWYWKDPRLAITLTFWQKLWSEPVYVIVVREPLDTALSLKKRDGLPLTAGILLWQRYMSAILQRTEMHSRRIFVQYERLLSEPADECRRLCDFLEKHSSQGETTSKNDRIAAMLAAVNPRLRSNANQGAFFSAQDATDGQKSLYRFLQSRCCNENVQLDPEVFDIYPGWRDYLEALAALDQVRKVLTQKEQELYARIRRKFSTEPQTADLPW